MITAASNSRIKRLVQLNQKSKLAERRTFSGRGCEDVSGSTERAAAGGLCFGILSGKVQLQEHLEEVGYEVVSDSVFLKYRIPARHRGVLCVLKQFHYNIEEMLRDKAPLFLLLENIQDPGNLGTMLRTGEGAGVSGLS